MGWVDPNNKVTREAVGGMTRRNMWINSTTPPSVIAHEVGHLMNIDDHYTDDSEGYSHANKGWEYDIMGASGMPVTQKSISELIQKQNLECTCK
jgi:hypothetical protein